ncbi:MAG: hypothetical protein OHK0052_17930 [Anaerolineales bacterium]
MFFKPDEIIFDGKYQIKKLVGEGAFAHVYLAEYLPLHQQRALKILRKDGAGVGSTEFDDYHQRFRQEAQLGAQHKTPYLVEVYDFIQSGDTLALAMAYAPNGNLAQRLEGGKPLPLEDTLRITIEIARGLAVLHEHDIVHRDLKPSNILFDAEGRAQIADLGLAQSNAGFSQRSVRSQDMPMPHPGTQAYMSPEQASSSAHLVPASDVYALGCILFEMLTGKVYKNQRPGTHVHTLRPDTPEWLADLLERMTAKNPEDRPWNGSEVLNLLNSKQMERATPPATVITPTPTRQAITPEPVQPLPQNVAAPKSSGGKMLWGVGAGVVGVLCIVGVLGAWLVTQLFNSNDSQSAFATQSASSERTQIAQSYQLTEQAKQLAQAANPTTQPARTVIIEVTATPVPQAAQPQQPAATNTSRPAPTVASNEPPVCQRVGQTWTRPADGMTMVCVPAGEFLMGSSKTKDPLAYDDETPQHKVFLDAYWVDSTEVSNEMYQRCVDIGACDAVQSGTQKALPVVNVSWQQAETYCIWAGGSLPTEAQWEKTARGTDGRFFPWGNDAPNCTLSNFQDCLGGVGDVNAQRAGASPYGALNMAGNVWEWVRDYYAAEYYVSSPSSNPTGPAPTDLYGTRGGSFASGEDKIRTAYRGKSKTYLVADYIGFRCIVPSP